MRRLLRPSIRSFPFFFALYFLCVLCPILRYLPVQEYSEHESSIFLISLCISSFYHAIIPSNSSFFLVILSYLLGHIRLFFPSRSNIPKQSLQHFKLWLWLGGGGIVCELFSR